jgi:hypothetical protein
MSKLVSQVFLPAAHEVIHWSTPIPALTREPNVNPKSQVKSMPFWFRPRRVSLE